MPTILQWNVNSLRPRLPELRRRLLTLQTDVLALQETYLPKGLHRFSPYVQYHSDTIHPDGKSRASLFIKKSICQKEIPLKDFNSTYDEHVAAIIRIAKQEVTVISTYVRPNTPWNPNAIRKIRARCSGPIIWCGDFNANHPAWGSDSTTRRGTILLDIIADLNLRCINTGDPTLVRPNLEKASVLDLTLVSPEIEIVWSLEPDTWGSDHIPIHLTPRYGLAPKHRVHTVTNWDMYRQILAKLFKSTGTGSIPLEDAICVAISKATKTVTLPANNPVPDLIYLEIRAASRRAQRIARRTNAPADWTKSRRIDAKLRRHTRRLGRQQWQLRSESLKTDSGSRLPWTTVRCLLEPVSQAYPFAEIAIKDNLTMANLAEKFADEFSRPVSPPQGKPPAPKPPVPNFTLATINDDFTNPELDYALTRCRRKGAPGADGITNQALKNIDATDRPLLLEYLNVIWRSGELPSSWLHSTVVAVPKAGKSKAIITSYRPISLTSCVCKLLERMIHRRLSWQLEDAQALPPQLSGFRAGCSTVDSIGNLTSSLEQAKAQKHVLHAVFLDIHRAFDALPHNVIMERLRHIGVRGRTYKFIASFLQRRTFHVKIAGHTSSPRDSSQGVPQGSVLSPLLFNIVMAGLPSALPKGDTIAVNCAIYADDVALWCTGPTRISTTIQAKLQQSLNTTAAFLYHAGLTLSVTKTSALSYRPRARLKGKFSSLRVDGKRIRRSTEVRYLGAIIDDRGNWRPAVKHTLNEARKLLGAIRRIGGRNWGASQQVMLTLYRGLIVNRILYSLPLLEILDSQWKTLETFHRNALRICLGLPRSSHNVSTIVEAGDSPLKTQSQERTLLHAARLLRVPSYETLIDSILLRHHSYLGKTMKRFIDHVGYPENIPPLPPPHRQNDHLHITTEIMDLPRRGHVADIVARDIANDVIQSYCNMKHIYTDGSRKDLSTTAAYIIPESNQSSTAKLSYCTDTTTAELAAIWLALSELITLSENEKVAIFTDSKGALRQLQNLRRGTPLARSIVQLVHHMAKEGSIIYFQWIPSHVGIHGNERADALANEAHNNVSQVIEIHPYNNYRIIIHNEAQTNHPHPGTASGLPPPTIPKNKFPRPQQSLLHRLRVNCANTYSRLHLMRQASSPNCPACDEREDLDHIFWTCPQNANSRNVLKKSIANGSNQDTRSLLFPAGPQALRVQTFKAILLFLQETGLSTRL